MADLSLLLSLVAGKQKAVDLSTASYSLKVYELKSDTISESTSAAGVSIDGLAIKDSKLVTDDCVVAANLTDSIILDAHISASAAIALSKLAVGTPAQMIVAAETTGVPTYMTMSGDATLSFAGALSIGSNKVGAAKIRLENNTALRARNAADSADVDILKVNASNIPEFSQFPITPSAAPDANYEVANKKYVDDSITSGIVGAMIYKGVFDASAGSFDAITNPLAGWFYKVSVAGSILGHARLISQGLTFTALTGGTGGNSISVTVIDSASGGLSYTEVSGEIIIDLGGDTPTTAQVVTHMMTTDPSAYVSVVESTAGSVAVASILSLSGGAAAKLYSVNDNLYLNKAVIGHPVAADIDLVDNTEAADLLRTTDLSSAKIFVGSAGNVAAAVDMSGDATISNTGVVSVSIGKLYKSFSNQTGSQIDAGKLVCLDTTGGQIFLADADALATCEGFFGVAVSNIAHEASGLVQIAGEATVVADAALDIGKEAFVSTVAGNAVKTAPSGAGDCVIVAGLATAADKILIHREFRYEL